jgi:hypothetical protein
MKSDQFKVMLNGVEVARRPHPMHAVNVAQGLCSNTYKDPVMLTIVRKPVLGPESILYRVDRVEDGTVYTTTISEED